MKKILIFSLAYYPRHVGGAEVAIKAITDRISPDEYEFHLICNRYDSTLPKAEKIGNVHIFRIGLARPHAKTKDTFSSFFYLVKILFIPLAVLKAFRLHKRYHYDGFWAMMLYMSFPVALLRAVTVRVPYVLTIQEGDTFTHVFERWYIRIFRPILLRGILQARVITSISTYLKGWATKAGYRGKSIVVPNAVDVQHFSKPLSAEKKEEISCEIGKREGEIWLVHTGRYVQKNGLDTCIEALTHLPHQFHLFLLGEGPDQQALQEQAIRQGVQHRVHMHPYVPIEDIPYYLKTCDIFVRPSRSEGMGNSFVEAMAAGVPVIGTREGGIADFLFDRKSVPEKQETGWVVDVEDAKGISSAARMIVEDQVHTKQVVEQAYNYVMHDYSWDVVAERMKKEAFDLL